MAKPLVTERPSRCAAATIRTYLSGRNGAITPARAMVVATPAAAPAVEMTRPSPEMPITGLPDHREPALAGEFVQRPLHDPSDVRVHLVDVSVLAELGGNIDRLKHLHDDLRG